MHENENNVMRTRTRTRTTKRGRERDLKIWPRDQVGLENLTSLLWIMNAALDYFGPAWFSASSSWARLTESISRPSRRATKPVYKSDSNI